MKIGLMEDGELESISVPNSMQKLFVFERSYPLILTNF